MRNKSDLKNATGVDTSKLPLKSDLKNATGVDTSKLPLKPDSVSLKAEVDKIDVDKKLFLLL